MIVAATAAVVALFLAFAIGFVLMPNAETVHHFPFVTAGLVYLTGGTLVLIGFTTVFAAPLYGSDLAPYFGAVAFLVYLLGTGTRYLVSARGDGS